MKRPRKNSLDCLPSFPRGAEKNAKMGIKRGGEKQWTTNFGLMGAGVHPGTWKSPTNVPVSTHSPRENEWAAEDGQAACSWQIPLADDDGGGERRHACLCPAANQVWPGCARLHLPISGSPESSTGAMQECFQPAALGQCKQPACPTHQRANMCSVRYQINLCCLQKHTYSQSILPQAFLKSVLSQSVYLWFIIGAKVSTQNENTGEWC